MKNLCKFFAVGLIFVSYNSKLFAPIEDDFLNRSVDKVPGVPQPRPGTPDGGYRAAFYKKKAAADAKTKLAQQQAAQQNPQPKAKKKIAAAKQFVYQNPPKAAKKIGDAQNFAANQQNLNPAPVPRNAQRIAAARQFADQTQSEQLRQAAADGERYRQEQDAIEAKKIKNINNKLVLKLPLTEEERATWLAFQGRLAQQEDMRSAQISSSSDPSVLRPPSRRSQVINLDRDRDVADAAQKLRREVGAFDKAVAVANRGDNQSSDQQNYVQPTPPLAPAPQRPRRAKRVPVPEKPRELDPESREIQRRIVEFMRNWEGSTDDPFYIDAPSRITEEVMALQLNDQY